jgi:putative heme iron utilization protein
MSNEIFAQVSDRICKHMNEDHADAILLYAKAFGNCADATAAQMASIDAQGMNLDVQMNGSDGTQPVRVKFDRDLVDAEDAHQTLIAMVKQARQALADR